MQLLPILYTVKLFVVHYLQISPAVSSVDIQIIARPPVLFIYGLLHMPGKSKREHCYNGFYPRNHGLQRRDRVVCISLQNFSTQGPGSRFLEIWLSLFVY